MARIRSKVKDRIETEFIHNTVDGQRAKPQAKKRTKFSRDFSSTSHCNTETGTSFKKPKNTSSKIGSKPFRVVKNGDKSNVNSKIGKWI